MHNNYYFLRQLSARLATRLHGYTLVSCFSQSKDELVFEFNNSKDSFFVKASLQPAFSSLSFPQSFHRARKNSVDLFNDALMKKVTGTTQFDNERSFTIDLEGDMRIFFKMHGIQSNVLLVRQQVVAELFRNSIEADGNLDVASLHRVIDWSRDAFEAHHQNLQAHYFTFGKQVWQYLDAKGFGLTDHDGQWRLLQALLEELVNPIFYIVEINDKPALTLFEFGTVVRKFNDPIVALDDFFQFYSVEQSFRSEKKSAMARLQLQIRSAESFVEKNEARIREIQTDQRYQQWADLIMANLHRIRQGDGKVEVENFYDGNKLVSIKLKPDLSPQKNAEALYRKGKNQHIETDKLAGSIARKRKEIARLQQELADIQQIADLKILRKKTGVAEKLRDEKVQVLPFHEFECQGFKIWVGRNADANDELTLRYSFKEDLWLHAKDVAGSHVVIKHQAGKNFPKDVIERAAQLAAYNSKRKTDTLCPVLYTPKKFVRKRKGDPAGAVVVEREQVILVEPKL